MKYSTSTEGSFEWSEAATHAIGEYSWSGKSSFKNETFSITAEFGGYSGNAFAIMVILRDKKMRRVCSGLSVNQCVLDFLA